MEVKVKKSFIVSKSYIHNTHNTNTDNNSFKQRTKSYRGFKINTIWARPRGGMHGAWCIHTLSAIVTCIVNRF